MLELEVSMGGSGCTCHGQLGFSCGLLSMGLSRIVHVGAVSMCDIGRGVEVRWFMAFKFEVKGFWHGLCVHSNHVYYKARAGGLMFWLSVK